MPYCIRNKQTGEMIKMRSGKSVWAQKGHAKAAYKTSGCYIKQDGMYKLVGGYNGGTFDEQDILELVEAELKTKTQRYRFMTDDDGHLYIIPAEKTERFIETLYNMSDDYVTFNNEFEEYYVGMSYTSFTFENPKEA